ncbi:MAG TPA: ATP-binding cassette domain-containing protein [Acidimicrobiales bacterium]|jgi:ABC-type Mn2+/Zn2+ transport system ATPase subunit|nr:ATP-binding cassette domain-containing protein [Acidimicrobiales bacterium]
MTILEGATMVVDEISKSFRRERSRQDDVLHDVTIEAAPGTLVLIEGDAGSGRSTLLRCLLGTYRVDRGSVVLRCDAGSVDLTTTDDRTLSWLRDRYFSWFDGHFFSPPHFPAWRALARSADLDESTARKKLEAFGAGDLGDVPVGRLLAAEARVVALATTLSRTSSFYLLDEPLLGQGEMVRGAAMAAVETVRSRGAAVLVSATPDSPWTALATSIHQLNRK